MEKILYILVLLVFQLSFGQDALHNFGNMKIHDQGSLGFHTNLINDGSFDNNKGLAGFYHEDEVLTVSGNNRPIFYQLEIMVDNNLNLETSVGVTDYADFILGLVITPRDNTDISLDFLNNSIYNNVSNDTHVDGYSSIIDERSFLFPIGDDFRFRPLGLNDANPNANTYKAAYFFEDPNNPTTFNNSFDTENFESVISIINDKEFWDLNGTTATEAILSWDEQSAINLLADDLVNLRVVGFSIEEQKWIDLGNLNTTGDFSNGNIRSNSFIPNDFEIITIGSILESNEAIIAYDIITPNGDGLNDTFVIKGIEAFPDNEVFIYNRWGLEVFSKKNYDNSFGGISDGRATIVAGDQLPVGTYYYVIKLPQRNDIAGPLYINRN